MVSCDASDVDGLDTAAVKADRSAKTAKTSVKAIRTAVKAVEASKLDKTVDDASRLLKDSEGKVQDARTRETLSKAIKARDAVAIVKAVKAVNDSKAAKEKADAEAKAKAEQEAAAARDAASDAVASLPEVDFSVGKEAFVSEWTSRINAYLAGSPLAGQGATFAEAAWSNGVDPRWSPAISNTESSKGAHCFLPYNAWAGAIRVGPAGKRLSTLT